MGGRLVGFVNVAWDGGRHAVLLDTAEASDRQRRGVGRQVCSGSSRSPARPAAGGSTSTASGTTTTATLHADSDQPQQAFCVWFDVSGCPVADNPRGTAGGRSPTLRALWTERPITVPEEILRDVPEAIQRLRRLPKGAQGSGYGRPWKAGGIYGFHLTKAAHASATVITRSTTGSLASA